MITRKKQRLYVLSAATVAVAGSILLIVFALGGDSLSLFRQPSDLVEKPVEAGKRVRLGGLVADGSLAQLEDGVTYRFTVTDCVASVRVEYRGLLPDLFREGQGIVSEGRFDEAGLFKAETVLAKHDENYTPEGTMPKNAAACEHPEKASYAGARREAGMGRESRIREEGRDPGHEGTKPSEGSDI